MELLAAGCLSQQQNELFARVLLWLQGQLSLKFVPADPTHASIIYMCGLPTGQNLDRWRPLAGPVMAEHRYRNKPIYFSDVICRPGFDARPWNQLKGARIGYNERLSFSGSAALLIEFDRLGIDPMDYTWVKTGSHQNSIAAVASGAVDLAAIDSMVLAMEDWTGGMVATLGPWPAPPISIDVDLADRLDAIGNLLTTMHTNQEGRQILAGFGVSRFHSVDGEDYRSMAALAERMSRQE